MANTDIAHLCDQNTCAQSKQFSWRFRLGWTLPKWLKPTPKFPPLSDHLARDIGLDAADLEVSRLQLPSQTTHHPYG